MTGKKYLIAINLNGTLLNNDKVISETNKRFIQLAIQQGHVVVIATGRSHQMSRFYYNELDLKTPIINANGALLHHPLQESWGRYHTPLDKRAAFDIIDLSYASNVHNIVAKVNNSILVDKHDDRILSFYKQTPSSESPFLIGNIRESLTDNPTLMMLYPQEENISTLNEQLSTIHSNDIQFRNWGPPFYIYEVMRKGLSKAGALKKIADYYHIPKNRIIAFGDEGNDMEMIDYAGVGVAMDNATSELKSIANHVTTSNEEDGVSMFLNKFLQLDKATI